MRQQLQELDENCAEWQKKWITTITFPHTGGDLLYFCLCCFFSLFFPTWFEWKFRTQRTHITMKKVKLDICYLLNHLMFHLPSRWRRPSVTHNSTLAQSYRNYFLIVPFVLSSCSYFSFKVMRKQCKNDVPPSACGWCTRQAVVSKQQFKNLIPMSTHVGYTHT